MSQINIKVDDDVKLKSEALFKRMGLTMSAAITMFLHQAINQHGLPFAVRDIGYSTCDNPEDTIIQNKLREASCYSREHSNRLTHTQVFSGLQDIIDAGH